MIFLYLPSIGFMHFISAAALGFMSVLSGKALRDMLRGPSDRSGDDLVR